MHDFFLDLWRIGRELRGEFGGMLTMMASIWICGTAIVSILKRAGKGVRAAWRRLRGKKHEENGENDYPEGS